MILLCLFHPEDIVEQQFLAIVRGQAAMGQAGTAHNDLMQLAGFGVDAERTSRHSISFHLQNCTDGEHDRDEYEQDQHQWPDKDDPAVVGHPPDCETADHHCEGGVDQIYQAVG